VDKGVRRRREAVDNVEQLGPGPRKAATCAGFSTDLIEVFHRISEAATTPEVIDQVIL
jgi:hypothetical protein